MLSSKPRIFLSNYESDPEANDPYEQDSDKELEKVQTITLTQAQPPSYRNEPGADGMAFRMLF
jgi:hypothetical protein